MKKTACMILVDFHPQISSNARDLLRRDTAGKQAVLRFFNALLAEGYRHFIVDIDKPSDIWVLQLLRGYQQAKDGIFAYSVGIRAYEEANCDWIEEADCDWGDLISQAQRVFCRRHAWYEGRYRTERLYISASEKWYDACDRCVHDISQHRYAEFTGRGRSMQEKLSELFVRQYQALLGAAFQLARNEDDALDLMQDLAETIARHDRPAASVEHPAAFFRTCLRNAWINTHKKAGREVTTEPEAFTQIPAEGSVEQDVVGSAAMEWLKEELSRYPEDMREAFYLYFFDGYSLDEVAKKLNISKNTLSQRFVRIRGKLVKKAADQSLFFALMVLFLLKPR